MNLLPPLILVGIWVLSLVTFVLLLWRELRIVRRENRAATPIPHGTLTRLPDQHVDERAAQRVLYGSNGGGAGGQPKRFAPGTYCVCGHPDGDHYSSGVGWPHPPRYGACRECACKAFLRQDS